MKGFIYCIQNKINGKCYIGQTARSVEERFKSHCDHSVSGNFKIQKAIRKYGKENFEVITLMYLESNSEIGLRSKLNYVEKYFIKRFNTRKCGYNMTDGGDGAVGHEWREKQKLEQAKRCKNQWEKDDGRLLKGLRKAQEKSHEVLRKKVLQFDLDGNFIRQFNSVREAIKLCKVKTANIDSCCRHQPKHKTAAGFIWRYLDEFDGIVPNKITPPKLYDWEQHYEALHSKLQVKINAYKSGKLVKQFLSIKDAYKYFRVTRIVLKRYIEKGLEIDGFILKRE